MNRTAVAVRHTRISQPWCAVVFGTVSKKRVTLACQQQALYHEEQQGAGISVHLDDLPHVFEGGTSDRFIFGA